jgi:hypothetical protein
MSNGMRTTGVPEQGVVDVFTLVLVFIKVGIEVLIIDKRLSESLVTQMPTQMKPVSTSRTQTTKTNKNDKRLFKMLNFKIDQ